MKEVANLNQTPKRILVTQMHPRHHSQWLSAPAKKETLHHKRLRRSTAIFAAVSFCLGVGAFTVSRNPIRTQQVMHHLTAGFEYDETLGRLQYVSSVLPESAMVFLSNNDADNIAFAKPVDAQVIHTWNPSEPWLEYAHVGDVAACQAGEIMTIVKNHHDEYTIRVMHPNGYESIYSGLCAVHLNKDDNVTVGQILGTSAGTTAFELRRDGLSILPSFSAI